MMSADKATLVVIQIQIQPGLQIILTDHGVYSMLLWLQLQFQCTLFVPADFECTMLHIVQ